MAAREPAAWLSAIVFVTYVGVSFGVSDLYPFSTFSMYSENRVTSPSRIAVRDAGGAVRAFGAFARVSCDGPVDVRASRCPALAPFATTGYLDAEDVARLHLEAGADPAAEPVEIIRRVWRVSEAPGAPAIDDCVLARCRAVRRSP